MYVELWFWYNTDDICYYNNNYFTWYKLICISLLIVDDIWIGHHTQRFLVLKTTHIPISFILYSDIYSCLVVSGRRILQSYKKQVILNASYWNVYIIDGILNKYIISHLFRDPAYWITMSVTIYSYIYQCIYLPL